MPNDPCFLALTPEQIAVERKLFEADSIIAGYSERGTLKNITVGQMLEMLKQDLTGESAMMRDEEEWVSEFEKIQEEYLCEMNAVDFLSTLGIEKEDSQPTPE